MPKLTEKFQQFRRLVLAILPGRLVSAPLGRRIFQPEINAQLSVIKQDRHKCLPAATARKQCQPAGRVALAGEPDGAPLDMGRTSR